MTHDELLTKVNQLDYLLGTEPSGDKAVLALRAVVELHKPVEDKWFQSGFSCAGCDNRCGCYEGDISSKNDWATCPTIEVIEKELA